MVWCASTLWAETADGYFRQRWLQTLESQGITSALLSPTREMSSSSRQRSPPRGGGLGGMSPISWSSDDDAANERRHVLQEKDEAHREELSMRLTAKEQQHLERAEAAKLQRRLAFHQRRSKCDAHGEEVRRLAQKRTDERVEHARAVRRERERRFLPVIDQCETQVEIDTLRAASFHVAIAVQRFVHESRNNVNIARMMMRLRSVLGPLVWMWRARRRTLARTYGALWRGRCNRPTPVVLQHGLPHLQSWTIAAVQQLIRKMRPASYPAGKRVFTDGEPGVAALYVSSGRVSVRQPRHHAPDLELGERGATYLHGEEILTKEVQIKHFTNLVTLEPTCGWLITRRAYLECAKNSNTQGDFLTATQVVTAASASKSQEYAEQAVASNLRLLGGWIHDELVAMLDAAQERTLDRGDIVFQLGEKATCAYLIVRGTVLLAQQIKRAGGASGGDASQKLDGTASSLLPSSSVAGDSLSPTRCPPVALKSVSDVESDDFFKEYANAGQVIGAEGLLFGSAHPQVAFAATDVVLLVLPHKVFLEGMFSDPSGLVATREFYNHQRMSRLIAPSLREVSPFFASPTVAQFFCRNMSPLVASRGDLLPLRSCVVFLQSGTVVLENTTTFKAPTVLMFDEALVKTHAAFTAALHAGTLELIRADRDPTRAALLRQSVTSGQRSKGGEAAHAAANAIKAARRLRASIALATPTGVTAPLPPAPNTTGMFQPPSSVPPEIHMDAVMSTDIASAVAPPGGAVDEVAATAPEHWGYMPLAGSTTLVVKHPLNRDADALDGTGVRRFRQLPIAVQHDVLLDELLEPVTVAGKCSTRVDAWCVRYVDIIRKFHGSATSARQMSDIVVADLCDKLTLKKEEFA